MNEQEILSGVPDLSLPTKAPSMAQYHHRPMTLHPAALYTLVDLSDGKLELLQRECPTGCFDTGDKTGNSVRPAPQARFVGQPLRAVFDYHLELGKQDEYEPRWFIATVDQTKEDWETKGGILVTLDDDDLACHVDQFRIAARDAGLSVVNLQIGNTSWYEEKEC